MMTVQTFRKKPVQVPALQWDGTERRAAELRHWTMSVEVLPIEGGGPLLVPWFVELGTDDAEARFGQLGPENPKPDDPVTKHRLMVDNDQTAALYVAANDAWLGIQTGEWIIKDSKGFYPCKSDVFEQTYELSAVKGFPAKPQMMSMESWCLDVDIRCSLPGPQLSTAEKDDLTGLLNHAEKIALVLFENHDPEGYRAWREEHPAASSYERAAENHPTDPEGGQVIWIRPKIEDAKDSVAHAFACVLIREREKKGLSRTRLTEMSGVSFAYLSEIERGAKYPKPSTLNQLATAFHMSVDDLVSMVVAEEKRLAR